MNTLKHEGKILRETIDTSGKSLVDIAKISKVSRAQIYLLFKQETIDQEYKDKLSKAGIEIDKANTGKAGNTIDQEVNLLKIAHLEETVTMLKEDVAFYKSLLTPDLMKKVSERIKKGSKVK